MTKSIEEMAMEYARNIYGPEVDIGEYVDDFIAGANKILEVLREKTEIKLNVVHSREDLYAALEQCQLQIAARDLDIKRGQNLLLNQEERIQELEAELAKYKK